jgi:hypothetical protein
MPSKAEFAESLSTIEGSGAKAGTPRFPRADPVRHSVCLSGSFRLRRKIRVVWPRMILVSVSEGPLTSGPIASLWPMDWLLRNSLLVSFVAALDQSCC